MSQRKWPEALEDPAALARRGGWAEEVYVDLLAVKRGALSHDDFDAKYLVTRAILVLDVTGFTVTAMRGGSIASFVRILDIHQLVFPLLESSGALAVHAFADDIVAIFDHCSAAIDAALALQARIADWSDAGAPGVAKPEACVGLGFGGVYEIGPSLAMGDEMNRASKLGEDIARGGEILVTDSAKLALAGRGDLHFEHVSGDDLLFAYHRVTRS